MNFKDWAPLKFVPSNLLSQIRLAYVFGKTGQEAFFVTKNDDVFACGLNYSRCLGLVTEEPQIAPIKIHELCNKNVKGFACSTYQDGAFVRAYSFDGTTYYWGKYWTTPEVYNLPTLSSGREYSSTVLEVVAGPDHGLILTSDGEIFSYGLNKYGQLGRSSRSSEDVPFLIKGSLKGRMISKVSCGAYFSVAIVDNGEVYAWGLNSDGQLGIGNEHQYRTFPNKIRSLTGVKIENIICGESYVLAVSNIGELYSWGKNDFGQLGLGDTISRFQPEKVKMIGKYQSRRFDCIFNRVIDVAATPYGSTTAAMCENNEVFMWGACGGIYFTKPEKTQFDSLFDVFAFIANPRIMHRPLLHTLTLDSVAESIKNAFEDSETSDLTIVADEKEIFVHKTILMLRSDYFKVLLQKPWLKEDTKILKLDQNYDGLRAYLQYLYSGDFKGRPEDAMESLITAHEYDDLTWKQICENHVIRCIKVENVADLYRLAFKLDAKDLVKHCVLFAGKHIGDVINTPGFSEWDAETHKQFVRDSYEQNVYKN